MNIARDQADYYFPSTSVSEDGFQWECETFGGLIHAGLRYLGNHVGDPDLFSMPECVATLHKWPSAALVFPYVHGDKRIGLRLSRGKIRLASHAKVSDEGEVYAWALAAPYDLGRIGRIFAQCF